MHQQQTAFENIVGKEKIVQFRLFTQCVPLNQKIVCPTVNIFDITSYAEVEEPKISM